MKKLLLPLLGVLFFAACEKENPYELQPEQVILEENLITTQSTAPKVDVCHYDADNDTWHVINISENALSAHLAHGDVHLVDTDGDGWVEAENECVPGGDCDDSDDTIYPGAEEVPGDGIDQDCDGFDAEVTCPCFTASDLDDTNFEIVLNGGIISLSAGARALRATDFEGGIYAIAHAGYSEGLFTIPNSGAYKAGIIDFTDGSPNISELNNPACAGLTPNEVLACRELICYRAQWLGGVNCDLSLKTASNPENKSASSFDYPTEMSQEYPADK